MKNKRYPTPKKWKPKHPLKYEGDVTNIIARSSWEIKFLNWCDSNSNIISYSSEELMVPYWSVVDEKQRRYFPDFRVKIKTSAGIKIYIVEIKPNFEKYPSKSKNKARALIENKTFITNQCKWKAAKLYCEQRGYEFMVIDEYDLGISTKKRG